MVERLKTDKKIVGLKQVKRAISLDEVKLVYIANDVDKDIKDSVLKACEDKNLQVVCVNSMNELGDACGIDVNAAIAALL